MSEGRVAYVGSGGEVLDAPAATRPKLSRFAVKTWTAGVLAALILAAGGIMWFNRPVTNSAVASSRPVSAEVLEKQYGAKIETVALLAAGGLIELRFQVVDKDKAMALFGPVDEMPMLAVEGTSKVLESAKGMKHHLTLLNGGSYFIFYTNAGNAVHEGSSVSMVINGVRLEHIVVQK
jgi:hypothetical protein